MPDRARPHDSTTRPNFLAVAATSAVAVVLGAAGWGLLDTLSPSADVRAQWAGHEVTLSAIPEGTQLQVLYNRRPVVIRHRTTKEIEAAENVSLPDLWDNRTLDVWGREIGSADDQVRRATPDGKFIVLSAIPWFCVGLPYAGDWDGWYDPCHGGQYDTSGRLREGVGRNMALPIYELVDADTLRLITNINYSKKADLDGLLYR